jgi:alkanesulfonate monooxygenase SsuD/methylene tetrahydromethanopterin reductase-like flavin-dependent oxidoreductase (luciferase family)
MKLGVGLFAQNYSDWDRFEALERGEAAGPLVTSDASIYEGELRLGSLVEPLGFDSLWTVEHHFTPYTMVTNPFQFLSFFAGRTERIEMGTMVAVLPWHDPIRVAESIVMLDHMLGGRQLTVGTGRGTGRREFSGLRVSMDESRDRFLESLDVLRSALSNERFSYDGTYYQIPETSLRPQPRSTDLLERLYCAWGSPATISIAAAAGLKPLFIPQKAWEDYGPEMDEYNTVSAANGYEPAPPIIVFYAYCAATEEEAAAGARQYLNEYGDSTIRHYELFGDHFAKTRGYEYYAGLAKMIEESGSNPFGDLYFEHQVWGTPEQCIEKIQHLVEVMAPVSMVAMMRYGSMTAEVAEKSMRLFAQEVLPVVQKMDVPTTVV